MSQSINVPRRYVGRPMRRFEDARFLRGQGTFMDDVIVPGALEVALSAARVHTRASNPSM